jgi:L-ascorbate metabolism protein UlaG (beta-lactamase superfamily)
VLSTRKGNIYFAGDTGWGPHFQLIAERFSPIRVALLPIGAYKPRWFMSAVHISPAEAVKAAKVLRATATVPIHYGTFPLGDDGQDEALTDLKRALKAEGNAAPRFDVLGFGEGRYF